MRHPESSSAITLCGELNHPGVDERAQLNKLIHKGKRSAQLLTKARILLKADVSEAGKGWSDNRIAEALDTGVANIVSPPHNFGRQGSGISA